jgi:predicted RND superfamily exporter protein
MPLLQGSLTLGLLGVTVSFLPVLFVLGFMGWVGIQVNMATCLIGGIAIGVAVDDTIYLLHRVRHEMAQGSDQRHAVRRGILVTGRAMTTTSLILMGGFLTMTLSDFMPSAEFGGLFAVTILLALLGDLLLLPLLLLHLPPRWRRKFQRADTSVQTSESDRSCVDTPSS